ncbi:MAG: efflux RND transporter periplasmic adaptor subunit [Gemmatimonadota bacterium]|nr:efflux RND transporter periplasmic adaptor subunit [Gemmatimonadota bacterium]MDH5759846.1 efflux RND transporter periplasmic adaptor subunit [Gemmatimonadota bacterium]
MSTWKQIVPSVSVVVAAAATVAFGFGDGQGTETQQAAVGGEHDHAAMAASGGEMKPVTLDAEAARRIGVAYTTVVRQELPVFVRTVGNVAYDETRLANVNSKIEGWVEKLHVEFTGAPVRAGQPLMDVYSPALVSAQEELILAARLVREASGERSSANAEELLQSARRRLAYWDIPDSEVRRIEESGETTKVLTLRAPATGVIIEKGVVEGDRIVPGMTVFRIADLSRVWVEADVFEKDLAFVGVGQGALVNFEAYAGRTFTGRVAYVYPTVSVESRTGRIRVELPNPAGELKPGMYATLHLQAPPTAATLVVPRSAVIETGERTLVFVVGQDGALYPREVTAGRASLQLVEILSGLEEGDRVVSSAAFLVDAESNLGTMSGEAPPMPGMDMGSMPGMDHSNH